MKYDTFRGPNPVFSFVFGAQPSGSARYFRGLLSDVRIYREALSAAEVAELTKSAGSPKPGDR